MSDATAIDVDFSVEGPPNAPVLVLSGSLGSTRAMWQPQVDALSADLRVVTYDARGHGASPVPVGPYTIADFGADLLRLLDRLDVERAHVAGLSLGGMTGMWTAAHAPERVDRLVLLCTSALLGPPEGWAQRAETVTAAGSSDAVAGAVVTRWFTDGYAKAHPEAVARMRDMIAATPPAGYAASCRAIETMDLRPDLPRITAPTLVLAGAQDPATPPAHLRAIAEAIPGSRLETVDPGAHLASWESAGTVNALLRSHLLE
ncbi:3-oxoadipate enol-lactonase [Spiractinospora alimapuensis]|uniref:3-oxoadipate enol-lactonase n=1 Tax=Spiractinospora alimapuensis TaxID=2820884 RepID=UPI001F37AAE9|nr:3-oxoadipate enol-lactonase [Spiractinospora alimapuensis]QVQ53571.1 3-oxoadipate enol-lactonase [Spiractinospora alimapuensis]